MNDDLKLPKMEEATYYKQFEKTVKQSLENIKKNNKVNESIIHTKK